MMTVKQTKPRKGQLSPVKPLLLLHRTGSFLVLTKRDAYVLSGVNVHYLNDTTYTALLYAKWIFPPRNIAPGLMQCTLTILGHRAAQFLVDNNIREDKYVQLVFDAESLEEQEVS
jgi:hypothetical protein